MSKIPYTPGDPATMQKYINELEGRLGIKSEVVHVYSGDAPDFPEHVRRIIVHADRPQQVEFAGRSINFWCGAERFTLNLSVAFEYTVVIDFGVP